MSFGQVESDLHHRHQPDSWYDLAACKGANPDMFFPDRGDNETVIAAKAVCARCPVRAECLNHALEHNELRGIWGGTTGRDRRRIRRQMSGLRTVDGQ